MSLEFRMPSTYRVSGCPPRRFTMKIVFKQCQPAVSTAKSGKRPICRVRSLFFASCLAASQQPPERAISSLRQARCPCCIAERAGLRRDSFPELCETSFTCSGEQDMLVLKGSHWRYFYLAGLDQVLTINSGVSDFEILRCRLAGTNDKNYVVYTDSLKHSAVDYDDVLDN